MAINLDKPHLWKQDTKTSVDYYNRWFMKFAPKAFRETRKVVTEEVEQAIEESNFFISLSTKLLYAKPHILRTLRMACCPPIAVDRLVGLADTSKSIIKVLEKGKLPLNIHSDEVTRHLKRIVGIISKLLDPDIFAWISDKRTPLRKEVYRASTIVADRLTGADANPIVRNAQERRQLSMIGAYLRKKGYKEVRHPPAERMEFMKPGTFTFHYSIPTGTSEHRIKVSIDAMIQPKRLRADKLPILVEAKSAGDFANTNKRRKEEAKKISQLKHTLGDDVCYVLFLCGYFDGGYLGYEAQDGIDWVWEHRIEDFDMLGI
jgi:hypothetical protein